MVGRIQLDWNPLFLPLVGVDRPYHVTNEGLRTTISVRSLISVSDRTSLKRDSSTAASRHEQ